MFKEPVRGLIDDDAITVIDAEISSLKQGIEVSKDQLVGQAILFRSSSADLALHLSRIARINQQKNVDEVTKAECVADYAIAERDKLRAEREIGVFCSRIETSRRLVDLYNEISDLLIDGAPIGESNRSIIDLLKVRHASLIERPADPTPPDPDSTTVEGDEPF